MGRVGRQAAERNIARLNPRSLATGSMPATKAVYVDLKKKTVAIEAKEGETLDGKAITAEITDAGYDVVKLETVQKSVEQIKAETKGRK